MNIHEYQGKEVLRKYGVAVPKGRVAFSVEEAVEAAKELGTEVCVVKAQIHAGGRGKAGGVKVAKNLDEVRTYASDILGKTLVTHQTGPEGKEVKRLLIEEGCDIKKEYYCTGYPRTGCVFCAFGCHLEKEPNRFQRLKETHPKLYNYCMNGGEYNENGWWQPNKDGLGMKHVMDFINVKVE